MNKNFQRYPRVNFNLIIWLSAGLVCLGCSQNEVVTTKRFVVEGYLYAGERVRDIKLKELNSLIPEDTTEEVIRDAQITLSRDGENFELSFDPGSGKYYDPGAGIDIRSGDFFDMKVVLNDRIATSSTTVPAPPENIALSADKMVVPQLILNPNLRDEIIQLFQEVRLELRWDNPVEESFYIVIQSRADTLDPILPQEVPREAKELLASFRFISEPSQETSFDIIGVALQTYGLHVAKVYKVNKEYEDLFNNLEQDSRDLNEPPSNVLGGLGIFTAFASDSIFFNVVRE